MLASIVHQGNKFKFTHKSAAGEGEKVEQEGTGESLPREKKKKTSI
jgi:hypothetical protein